MRDLKNKKKGHLMRRLFQFITASLIAICLSTAAMAGDPTWDFTSDDAEMNAAIAEAQRTMPIFVAKLDETDLNTQTMLLKVGLPFGNDGYEHIWCQVISRDGDTYEAVISNDPVYIDAKQYDPVTIKQAQVSDWTYWNKDGKMEGAYTLRVMLPRMDKDQAASLAAQLAPLPTN
jgi:uncharacterized protein YegJ (DUF2314 family)